ncbi:MULTISPECIES: DUF2795 domain-containing protein [Micromonospora]|jgi:hypothetical protein|uniref:DUF2795 domain-containing protein n=1 Tax=Micromonospora sicca TaxID=2202420 RepID=A0A317DUI5_9ACTN|nr:MULTISPECIES: DUF2795 domain-containing protein [unclassified Micromonospora]MBM0226148.1 DUF2795 domain-containing protein [Micromonospora sp. ATA51]MDZ5444771.1 DUF2795 domain-containing protein [Micromonospora sp. 4G57]MDZ5491327.1 DUF2795 domain-containing protein [Micromonospora sp. 4G53]PWR16475.1 hypothetical protein DKT69_05450 [Micromonospora sp. 4G51]
MTVTGVQLQEYLAGLDYPVSREDLIRWGQENGASTEVLQMLKALPAEQFDSPAELGEALGTLA